MATYSMSSGSFTVAVRRRIVPWILILVAAGGAGMYIAYSRNPDSSPFVPVGVGLLLIIILISTFRRSLASQRDDWYSYELIIDPTKIMRRVSQRPDVAIPIEEISAIKEDSDGISISGSAPGTLIFVAKGLEDYEGARHELSSIAEITTGGRNYSLLIGLSASALVIVLMLIVLIADNSYLVVPSGVLLVGGLVWGSLKIYSNSQLDARTRRMSFMIWLPILVIVAKVLAQLGAF